MKIKYSILSVDDNPLYQGFWDINKKLWFYNMGIKPILAYITDDALGNYHIDVQDDYIIFNIKKIKGIDSGFQSQVSRLFVTQFFPKDVLITSDIDMFPLSKDYFVNQIKHLNEDKMVIFSSDAYPDQIRYPMCYNAAKGELFKDLLGLNKNFKEFCETLLSYNWGWDTDEKFFGMKIQNHKRRCIFLNRGWQNGMAINRIDRVAWNYNISDIKSKKYIDCHSLRPFNKYQRQIKFLINNYLK